MDDDNTNSVRKIHKGRKRMPGPSSTAHAHNERGRIHTSLWMILDLQCWCPIGAGIVAGGDGSHGQCR